MCGIVGYIGPDDSVPILLDGLKRLEYRGYDSAGLAVLNGTGRIELRRSTGKLANLEKVVSQEPLQGSTGIGHTRWATHGPPSEANAHPHRVGGLVLVHNGIIENHMELKKELLGEGRTFMSETDTEVLCHLIDRQSKRGLALPEAVRAALAEVRGTYAIGVVSESEPGLVVGARNGSPLIVGLGDGASFLASDVPAVLPYTRDVIFLDDGDVAVLSRSGVEITGLQGDPRPKTATRIDWNPVMAERGGYKHFMLKEIHEQPRSFSDTLLGRYSLERGEVEIEGFMLDESAVRDLKQVVIVACGTSWHAGLIARYWIEALARLPVTVDIASEFRYRDPLIPPGTLFVGVTQSGETADTLAAQREARRRGARTVAICNVVGSTATREADAVVYTHAGPEIGVASTKAFTSQLAALFLLAVRLGRGRGTLTNDAARSLLEELIRIPHRMEEALARSGEIAALARRLAVSRDFLYLGRGINFPVALEGALKLKEISYIHAEGYPAGELKHGPIALIDEQVPVVVLAPHDAVYEKVLSNLEEVRARGGRIIAVTDRADESVRARAEAVLDVPATHPLLTPILFALPLQLLAYHIADLKGCDVDQPRNLAKSVTVE
ncbi:MAG: glutamine--fructose-6-phosphate aminotransferase [Nitrospirae bacterium RBG_16_64_22]|nr:MAG: glutamine--fructose-6-phosphate aminotransferase [Nitrospirae bacterium RBG_16_64_22]